MECVICLALPKVSETMRSWNMQGYNAIHENILYMSMQRNHSCMRSSIQDKQKNKRWFWWAHDQKLGISIVNDADGLLITDIESVLLQWHMDWKKETKFCNEWTTCPSKMYYKICSMLTVGIYSWKCVMVFNIMSLVNSILFFWTVLENDTQNYSSHYQKAKSYLYGFFIFYTWKKIIGNIYFGTMRRLMGCFQNFEKYYIFKTKGIYDADLPCMAKRI